MLFIYISNSYLRIQSFKIFLFNYFLIDIFAYLLISLLYSFLFLFLYLLLYLNLLTVHISLLKNKFTFYFLFSKVKYRWVPCSILGIDYGNHTLRYFQGSVLFIPSKRKRCYQISWTTYLFLDQDTEDHGQKDYLKILCPTL